MAYSIADFLYRRKIACDVKGARSTSTLDMPIGCVQGSTLGPRLFALYLGKLAESLEHNEIVGFANDTYVVINGKSIKEIKAKTEALSVKHVNYLESLEMIVNKSKTEAVLFGKAAEIIDVKFAGTTISTTTKMKALGLILSHNLKWDNHINAMMPKSNAKLSLPKENKASLNKGTVHSRCYKSST